MPLLAAVLVVNHRHGTTETRVVPLADRPLWPIIPRRVGAALRVLRGRLGRPRRDPLTSGGHPRRPQQGRANLCG